jgi:hypothetical protein
MASLDIITRPCLKQTKTKQTNPSTDGDGQQEPITGAPVQITPEGWCQGTLVSLADPQCHYHSERVRISKSKRQGRGWETRPRLPSIPLLFHMHMLHLYNNACHNMCEELPAREVPQHGCPGFLMGIGYLGR